MLKIRLKYGENEIELDGPDNFVKKELEKFYASISQGRTHPPQTPGLRQELLSAGKPALKSTPQSPAEFYKSKNRTDGISQVLIFAKYLEQYRGKNEFARGEVNAVAREAKLSKDIHSQYFTNAVKQGLLRMSSGGKYSLTLSAEETLASM